MKDLLARFEHELLDNPALVDSILQRPDIFPAPPAEPEPVLIRSDEASAVMAIARAARLAVDGVKLRMKLVSP